MIKEKIADTDEKPIYFAMKLPDWFIGLGVGEKKRLAKLMLNESKDAHKLSKEELKNLMPRQEKKTV